MKKYLIDKDLFKEDVKDYKNQDLDYKKESDMVGIKSEIINGKRKYTVYLTDERGNIVITNEFDYFEEAIDNARKLYYGVIGYYRGIDITKIRKYFTEEKINKIYKRLKEIGIDELPVLGTSIEYGLGCICLEEDYGIFKFYIIDRASKFEFEHFDNIKDAINKLVLCYKNFELVDDADKMKEIFYQVLGLNLDKTCKDDLDINHVKKRIKI